MSSFPVLPLPSVENLPAAGHPNGPTPEVLNGNGALGRVSPEAARPGLDTVKIQRLEQQVTALRLVEIHNDRLERELNVLRREMTRLQNHKRATELELLEARRQLPELERRVAKVKSSISYQLGSALVDSAQSFSAARKLPSRLFDVYRSSRALRARRALSRDAVPMNVAQSAEAAHFVTAAVDMVSAAGAERAAEWARRQEVKPAVLAYGLIEIAKSICAASPELAGSLGIEAIDLFATENRAKMLAFQLADLGHISLAVVLINKATVAGAVFNPSEARKAENLRALARLIDAPPAIPSRSKTTTATYPHVAFIGREIVPFDVSCAALRLADRVACARQTGADVTVITPPGYPGDRRVRHPLAASSSWLDANGAKHVRLSADEYTEDVADLYLSATAESIAKTALAQGVTLIHAEGFFIHGVSAALAARSAGCPLIIEIDDLLDQHEPYFEGFERTERGQMQLWMTIIAARAADVCIVRNERMAYVLVQAGIPAERIVLAPDVVVAARPSAADIGAFKSGLGLGSGPVIGVVRDLCDSYDSVSLADVLAGLISEFPGLKLLVAGQGRGRDALLRRAAGHRVSESLVVIDNPRADQMALYRAALDVAIFTRYETMKTAMLSAYELTAAMAFASPIAAYHTSDITGLIEHDVSGLLSPPGDATQLTHSVRRMLADEGLRVRLGIGARDSYLKTTSSVRDGLMAKIYGSLLPGVTLGVFESQGLPLERPV